jgi:hypothetical protein
MGDMNHCPECASRIEPNDSFCRRCGASVKPSAFENSSGKRGISDKEKRLLLILITIVLVALSQALFFGKSRSNRAPSEQNRTVLKGARPVVVNPEDGSIVQVMRFLKSREGGDAATIIPLEWGQVKTVPRARYTVQCKYHVIDANGRSTMKNDLFFIDESGAVVFRLPVE